MTTSTRAGPYPATLAGTAVVAVVLGLSRWGTNLGLAPLFISDALIALSVGHFIAARAVRGAQPTDAPMRGVVTSTFVMFFAYFLARFALSFGQSDPLLWLRDGVPFAYAALAILAAASLSRSDGAQRARTMRVMRWALTFHLLWVAVVSLTGNYEGFDILGPFGSAPAFQVRPDIDIALIALATGLSVRQVILGRRRFWNIVGIVLGTLVVFGTTTSRAGHLSFIASLAVAYFLSYVASQEARGRRLALVAAVPILVVAVAIILPETTAGQRFLATIMPSGSQASLAELEAQGTARAREFTWTGVIDWTNEEPARALFGSGFGNDFLKESGTLSYLEGSTYTGVRSPHNWFVGIYARLGIAGTVLVAAWLLQLLTIIWRQREQFGQDDLGSFSVLTVTAIIPVASFGVVLEAPFGAIPFFWATGILMAMRPASEGASGWGRSLSRVRTTRPYRRTVGKSIAPKY